MQVLGDGFAYRSFSLLRLGAYFVHHSHGGLSGKVGRKAETTRVGSLSFSPEGNAFFACGFVGVFSSMVADMVLVSCILYVGAVFRRRRERVSRLVFFMRQVRQGQGTREQRRSARALANVCRSSLRCTYSAC